MSYLTTEAGSMLNGMSKMYISQIDALKSKGVAIDYDNRIVEMTGK